MPSVLVGVKGRPLAERVHQRAGARLGGSEAGGGRLDGVGQAEACLADGDGRQLALVLCR